MVVNDVGKVICGQFVDALEEHLVVEDVGLHAHFAAYHVVDDHLTSRLNEETHHILVAFLDKVAHGAVVEG